MAGIQVTRSFDWLYLDSLIGVKIERIEEVPKVFYVVTNEEKLCGGFIIIQKEFGPELHTILHIHGVQAKEAFRKLLPLVVRDTGSNLLRTFAPVDNRCIRLAALIGGFREIWRDKTFCYYELKICANSTSTTPA